MSQEHGDGGKSSKSRRYSNLKRASLGARASHRIRFSVENLSLEHSSGLVLDFIVRLRKRLDQGNFIKDQAESKKNINLVVGAEKDTQEYENAQVVIERLYSTLIRALMPELKGRGKPWPMLEKGSFKRAAEKIRMQKREVMCFRVETENYLLRFRLLNGNKETWLPLESAAERRERMEDFWVMYHNRFLDGPLTTKSRVPSPYKARRPRSQQRTIPRQGEDVQEWKDYRAWLSRTRQAAEVSSEGSGSLSDTYMLDTLPSVNSVTSGAGLRSMRRGQETIAGFGSSRGFENCCDVDTAVPLRINPKPFKRSALALERLAATSELQTRRKPCESTLLGKSASSPSLQSSVVLSSNSASGTVGLPPIADRSGRKYMKACNKGGIVPTPLRFVTGHSPKFEAAWRDLTDRELLAYAATLSESEQVEEVDLSGNSLLTDKALAQFLWRLVREPAKSTLQKLSLGHCVRAGLSTQDVSAKILGSIKCLRQIDLSHIALSTRVQLQICMAIGSHPCLRVVSLADAAIGGSCITKQCLTSLLSSKTVHNLDISWNCFNAECFQCLGERVMDNKALQQLCISNCSGSAEGDPPASHFVENLSRNKSLTSLDISMNGIDYTGALVMEDSLDHHKKLGFLNVSQNPLGPSGIRCIFRLLGRDHTGLTNFDIDGCCRGGSLEGSPGVQVFHNNNPGVKYDLKLESPYNRALLRMLYKTAERFKLTPEQAFQDFKPSEKGFSAAKDPSGVWRVPTYGIVSFAFHLEKALESIAQGVADADFVSFFKCYYNSGRLQPGFKKVIPMLAQWKMLDGREAEQRVFLDALAKDFSLPVSHLEHMCQSLPLFANETVWRLLPGLTTGAGCFYHSLMMITKYNDFMWVKQKVDSFLNFNEQNPTGRYSLDLGNPTEFAVADKLMLLDRWETACDRRNKLFDISSRGNGSHVRNETYRKQALYNICNSLAEWSLPSSDLFTCDYSSNQRAPVGVQVLGDRVFDSILSQIHRSEAKQEHKILVLRMISHNVYISSMQMRQILGFFKEPQDRDDTFVIFAFRIVDSYNEKVYRVRFETPQQFKSLQERLGYIAFFPFFQPENARFDLDFAFYDQRLCACILRQLATKEMSEKSVPLQNYEFYEPDGTAIDLTVGVPLGWETLDRLPKQGRFKATYICAPEFKKFGARKNFAEVYGHHQVDVAEDSVMWWTGLLEPPPDVIELLEHFLVRGISIDSAFRMFDDDSKGLINFPKFRKGLIKVGCEKFKCKDELEEKERVTKVFRYLDPGKEGTVNLNEWRILDQLLKEFLTSIREFVQFCVRTFGSLDNAWDMLDDDGSNEISEDEFLTAVSKEGYFGPAQVVFALLDSSDDNNISRDEFKILEDYKGKPASR